MSGYAISTRSGRDKLNLYRLAAEIPVVEFCNQFITYSPLNDDQNVIADYDHAFQRPNAQNTAICKGPDGQPWCAFIQREDSGALYGFAGPFVVRWDATGAAWVFVDDTGIAGGGVGEQQDNGQLFWDLQGVAAGSSPADFWDLATGAYAIPQFASGPFTGTITPFITCDGESVYVIYPHAEAIENTPFTYTGRRSWWKVKMWDGSVWEELDDGVAHTHIAHGYSGGDLLGSNLGINLPRLIASDTDIGHPWVLYRDTTPIFHNLYVSQWDGSAWNDLGGGAIAVLTIVGGTGLRSADITIDEQGRPTVAWIDIESDDDMLHIVTLKAGAWVDASVSLNTMFGTSDLALDLVHISPVEINPDGDYRCFIGCVCNVTGFGDTVFIVEYFPELELARPMLNDVFASHVEPLDGTGQELMLFAPDPLDRAVWINTHPGGSTIQTVYRYDAVCDFTWAAMGDPISSGPLTSLEQEFVEMFPPMGYRNGMDLYFENAYGDFHHGSGVKLAHKGVISCVECTPSNYLLIVRIDGEESARVGISDLTQINDLWIGAYYSSALNKHDIDDVLVGTTGYGSSDLFSFDGSAAIVPPFDSTVNGTDLSIVAGQLHVENNPGVDAFAVKTLNQIGDLYIQFKLTISSDEWTAASGSYTSDFMDITDQDGNQFTGIYARNSGTDYWDLDGQGPDLSTLPDPAPDTQFTIDFFFRRVS